MKLLWITTTITCICSIIAAMAADIWLSERIAVFGSFAGLQYSLNPGIAWGIRLPAGLQELLIGCALIAVLYLACNSQKSHNSQLSTLNSQLAYGCILGGGIANSIDRVPDGYVTDFIQIGSFPIFNIADSFVTIGVVLLLIDSLQKERSK